jgi:hypothetical protein
VTSIEEEFEDRDSEENLPHIYRRKATQALREE